MKTIMSNTPLNKAPIDGMSVVPLLDETHTLQVFVSFLRSCSQDERYLRLFVTETPKALEYNEVLFSGRFADFVTQRFWNERIELA